MNVSYNFTDMDTLNSSFMFGDEVEKDLLKMLMESFRNKSSGGSWISAFSEYTNLYLTPVIIFTGLCGNALSFTVFTCTYLRMKSSSIYLATLSVADAGFLLCLFFIWLARVNVPLFHMSGWCQLFVYLNHVFYFLSAWSVVGFTCERYIAVYHPLRKDRYSEQRISRMIIFTTSAFALVSYIYNFWTSGVREVDSRPICMPLTRYYDMLTVITIFDMFIAFLLPSSLIVVLNIRIMLKLRAYQQQSVKRLQELRMKQRESETVQLHVPSTCIRKLNMVASLSRSGSMHFTFVSRSEHEKEHYSCRPFTNRENVNHVRKSISQYRTARILLLVSTVFLVLNSPNHILKMQAFIRNLIAKSSRTSKKLIIWQELFQLVYFLNFAINFFIYSLCSKTFRSALKRLHLRCRKGTGLLLRIYKKSTN